MKYALYFKDSSTAQYGIVLTKRFSPLLLRSAARRFRFLGEQVKSGSARARMNPSAALCRYGFPRASWKRRNNG